MAEGKDDSDSLFFNTNFLGTGVDWEEWKKGKRNQDDIDAAKKIIGPATELWAGQDPLNFLLNGKDKAVWKGTGTMGSIDIEITTIPGENNGVPQIEFTDHFEFNRISTDPSTVAYRQNVFANPGQHLAGMLIHSECGYFRWFPTAVSQARKYEFEQCRAVGRGISTLSQGNRAHSEPGATLEFDMSSSTEAGGLINSYATNQGGINQDGTPKERSPRGFGIALQVANKWTLKDGKLKYYLTIEIQNPAVVESPEVVGKGPGAISKRFIRNDGMTVVDTPLPYPTSAQPDPPPVNWPPTGWSTWKDSGSEDIVDNVGSKVGPPPYY